MLCSSTNPSTSQIQTALEKWVTDALPGSEILSSAAGALTVGVGKNNGDHLNKFLRCIQTDKYMEWSLSNSTLEEVFLKLCATNSGVNKQVIAEGRSCQLCAVNPAERVNLYTVSGIRVVVTGKEKGEKRNFILIPFLKIKFCSVLDVICSDCAHKTAAEQKSASVSSRALESDQVLNFNSYLIKELESSTPSFSTVAASTSSKAHDLYTLSAPNSNTSTEGHDVAGNERSQAPLFSQIFAIFLKNCTMEVLQRRKLNIATIFLAVVTIACKVLINMQFSKADAPGCSVVLGEPPGPYTSPAYYGCSATALVKYMEPELLQLNYDRDKATVDGSFTTSWDIEGDSIYQIENQNGTKLSLSQYLTNSQSDVFVPLLIMESPNPQDLSLHDSVRWTPRKSYQSPQDIGNVETSSGKITVKRSSPSQSMGQYLISQQQMISSNKQALSAFCSSSEGFLVSNSSQLMSILPVTYPQVAIDVAGYDQTLNLKLDIYFKKSLSYKIAKTRGSSQFPSIFLSDPNLNSPHCTSLTARQILYSSYMNYQSEPNMVQILESANIMTNSLLSKALGVNTNPASPLGASVASSKQPNIKAKFSNLPKVSRNVISPFLSVAIAMIATCFMFPRLTSLFVEERISGLSEMMRIQGISPPVYWLGNLIFGFTVIGAFCLVTFAAFIGIDSSSRGVAFVLLVAFVLWAASQVVLVVLLSRLVSSTSSSNMVSIMFYLISTIASIILVGGESDTNTGSLPLTYCIFPPFAFASTVNTALLGKAVNTIGPTFGVWIASIVVIGILGISAQLSSRLNIKGMLGGDSSSNSSEENGGKTASLHVDPDVAREEQEIQQSLYHMKTSLLQKDATNSAIKLFHLRKEYKDKVAVKDLSLNIKYGETFGLLGPNGAGKSTTISCFTGLERSTSGLIQIDGTSLEDIKHIWKLVGVCPQVSN